MKWACIKAGRHTTDKLEIERFPDGWKWKRKNRKTWSAGYSTLALAKNKAFLATQPNAVRQEEE